MTLTLVTMLFDINKRNAVKRRSVEEYLEWGKIVLNLKHDMVIYCEPDIVDRIKELRAPEAKTEIIPMLFEELPQYKWLETIKKCNFPNTNAPSSSLSVFADLIIMWWSKLRLLSNIAVRNPFNSSHVAHIDFGIAHCVHNWIVPEVFIVLPNKIRFHVLRYIDKEYTNKDDYYHHIHSLLAGNYYVGPVGQVEDLANEFDGGIEEVLCNNWVAIDEEILARIVAKQPEKYLYSYGAFANVFTNCFGVYYNLGHISKMLVDARKRKGWQFICDVGSDVVKNYENGMSYNMTELEAVLSEYYIGAYYLDYPNQERASFLANLYVRLLDMDHDFYSAYLEKRYLIQSNFSYLPNPPKLPWGG